MGEQKKRIDLTGKRFGRLVVVDYAFTKDNKAYWNCICDCGNTCVKKGSNLMYDVTKSCGCLHKEQLQQRNTLSAKWKGSSTGDNQRLYHIWCAIRNRCYSEHHVRYDRYGGRGIKVCDEWLNDFYAFEDWSMENGYQDDLTIDRIDFDGDYEPDNCRWITQKEQCNNKSDNKYLEYKGEIHTLSEWCDILDIPYDRTKARLNTCHMTVEQAFELPKQNLRRKVNRSV